LTTFMRGCRPAFGRNHEQRMTKPLSLFTPVTPAPCRRSTPHLRQAAFRRLRFRTGMLRAEAPCGTPVRAHTARNTWFRYPQNLVAFRPTFAAAGNPTAAAS